MGIFGKFEKLENLKLWVLQNKDKIKTVALPVLVIAAVFFFWFSGKGEDVTLTDGKPDASEVQMQEEDVDGDGMAAKEVSAAAGKIFVDIGGEVAAPGVYEVTEGTRLFEVINRAGGLTEEADIDVINRAETVYDGQKILIASYEETRSGKNTAGTGDGQTTGSGAGFAQGTGNTEGEKVNINTADSAELQSIPGIGPSKADRIIEYRNTQGRFNTIEDIKNISGIGNKTFESIKKYIVV